MEPHRNKKRGKQESGEVSRREFVTAVGAITGGIALGFRGFDPQNLGSNSTVLTQTQESRPERVISAVLTINGRKQELSLDPRVTLLDLLREQLGLTGTKKGCDHGQCGACTVLANGIRINSCLSLAVTRDGDEITTIEGIAKGEDLHPMQAAFLEHDGLQCGYCTPGQICSAIALLREAQNGDASFVTADLRNVGPVDLSTEEIRERMSGNICRCGAYPGIVAAVEETHRRTRRSAIASSKT